MRRDLRLREQFFFFVFMTLCTSGGTVMHASIISSCDKPAFDM